MKRLIFIPLLLAIVIAGIVAWPDHAKAPSKPAHNPAVNTTKTVVSFDKTRYSTTDPTSLWVVVNKQHPLNPKDYIPSDLTVPNVPLRVPGNESMQLRKPTAVAVETMFAAAKQDGLDLMISSGYRSYTYQVGLYGGYVSSMGQASADTQSARPGYSEHQTGLALDIEPSSRACELEQCFADTPEGKWLASNAYKYGFILRYTPTDVAITGYQSEPWHYRYIGVDLATEMHKQGVTTLEKFFGISGGQSY